MGYSIVNAKDGRYLTEKATFGTDPFDIEIHTFTITQNGDGFVISNKANSRTTVWTVDANGKIVPSRDTKSGDVITLIPVK